MTNKKTTAIVSISRGKPITDADIERMADEAEAGYDLTTLRPRGGRPPMGSGPAASGPRTSRPRTTRRRRSTRHGRRHHHQRNHPRSTPPLPPRRLTLLNEGGKRASIAGHSRSLMVTAVEIRCHESPIHGQSTRAAGGKGRVPVRRRRRWPSIKGLGPFVAFGATGWRNGVVARRSDRLSRQPSSAKPCVATSTQRS